MSLKKAVYVCVNTDTGFTLYNKVLGTWNDGIGKRDGSKVWTFSSRKPIDETDSIQRAIEWLNGLGFEHLEFRLVTMIDAPFVPEKEEPKVEATKEPETKEKPGKKVKEETPKEPEPKKPGKKVKEKPVTKAQEIDETQVSDESDELLEALKNVA